MSQPLNHHYVPRHFLRAWSHSEAQNRIYRYRLMPSTGSIECKAVPTKRTASAIGLYSVRLPDGTLDVESSTVTPKIDEPGHKVLEKARRTPFAALAKADREQLARYIVCLEARHPDVLKMMDQRAAIAGIGEAMRQRKAFDTRAIDECVAYFQSASPIGPMMLSMLEGNERSGFSAPPLSGGLLAAHVVELAFQRPVLMSSSFPCFRSGDYLRSVFLSVALSPYKALVYSSSDGVDAIHALPPSSQAALINLYTVGFADCGYATGRDVAEFVRAHLGWARARPSGHERQAYVAAFLRHLLGEARSPERSQPA